MNTKPSFIIVGGIGAVPTELAAEAGLKIDNGMVVDEHLHTQNVR